MKGIVVAPSRTMQIPSVPSETQETAQVLEFFTTEMMAVHAELLKRTRALEDANHRLQEIDQIKTRLVGDVAHELRAPLASILLKLDLIERGQPANRDRYLNDVRKQVRRLGHMIESILDLTRVYMTNPAERFVDVDVESLAFRVVEHHRDQALNAGLELAYRASDSLPLLLGDPEQIERVFNNLISNAIKYTLKGSVTVSLTTDIGRRNILFCVQDTGMGIAPDDMDRLFQRFFRGRLADSTGIQGTGLGLAIVKEIVDLHGGGIDVRSEPDVGSTFLVTLPALVV